MGPVGHYEVGECCKCSIEANRTGKPFLIGFKVLKMILRFLGYYVLRYEGNKASRVQVK